MARSGTYTFTVTRDQLITDALINVGALDPEGGTATATQISSAALVLNMMVKSWEARGLNLWKRQMITLTLNGGTTYSLGSGNATVRPKRILDGYIRATAGNDTPIRIISREEYNRFGLKSTTGTTVQVYYDPQLDNGVVYVYPVQASGTLILEAEYPLMDFTNTSDEPDFPQEWFNALRWNLAKEIALSYGVSPTRYGTIKNNAKEELDNVEDFDTEFPQSVFFNPTPHGKK